MVQIIPVPIDPSFYPDPYCKLVKGGAFNIFTSIGETVQYRISDYVEGYNLQIKGDYEENPQQEVAKIFNPVELKENQTLSQSKFVKRYSAFHSISGSDYLGRLLSTEFTNGERSYFINF